MLLGLGSIFPLGMDVVLEASQHYCINLVNKWMSRFSNAAFVQIECVRVYVYVI